MSYSADAPPTLIHPSRLPSRRAPLMWAATGAVPWLFGIVTVLGWALADPDHAPLQRLAFVGTVVGLAVAVVVAPIWRYRVHRWDVSGEAVYTRTGWLTQASRIAPISRVQTVDTYRGPVDRLLGLANVRVTTASSAGAIHIVALDAPVADQIVAWLTDVAGRRTEDAT